MLFCFVPWTSLINGSKRGLDAREAVRNNKLLVEFVRGHEEEFQNGAAILIPI